MCDEESTAKEVGKERAEKGMRRVNERGRGSEKSGAGKASGTWRAVPDGKRW